MQIEIVRNLDESMWRDFVDGHPQSNIFHTPEMFEVFDRAQGHRPELWAATQGGRVLALLLPVKLTLMGGLLKVLTTRFVAYGSVLCAPGVEGQEALKSLLQTYARDVGRVPLFTEQKLPTLTKCDSESDHKEH